MGDKCCSNCFSDLEIKKYIEEIGELSSCDYCESKQVHCAPGDIGDFIREGIERAYETVDDGTGAMYDPEIKSYTDEGDPIEVILKWDLCIFSDKLDDDRIEAICEDLISESGPSSRDVQKGAYDWISAQNLVVRDALYGFESTPQHSYWEIFKYTCKYFNRYFDLGGHKSSRAKILSSLDGIFSDMAVNLPKGTTLFRGRLYTVQTGSTVENINLLKEISPPPPSMSRNSRMSPAGTSYTYLASDTDTCLGEVHAQSGDNILVGKFITKKKLRVLDLSVVPSYRVTSCFSPEYDHSKNWLGDFVEHFKEEISAPIPDEGKDIEYVATQLLAEYIRKKGFHGIKFKSSLHSGGYNYVLFCSVNPYITDSYHEYAQHMARYMIPFTSWLNLINIRYIKCATSYDSIAELRHDDKTAEYQRYIQQEKEHIKKIRQIAKNATTDWEF